MKERLLPGTIFSMESCLTPDGYLVCPACGHQNLFRGWISMNGSAVTFECHLAGHRFNLGLKEEDSRTKSVVVYLGRKS